MAGKPIARIGDTWEGICYSHESPISVTGEIITGNSLCVVQGKTIARDGDTVEASCGHTDTIIATSSVCTIQGDLVARVDDETTGSTLEGKIIEGAPGVTSL